MKIMTEKIERIMAQVLVGSLRQSAQDFKSHDIEYSNELTQLADHIEEGTATEDELIEAFEQVDTSDYDVTINW